MKTMIATLALIAGLSAQAFEPQSFFSTSNTVIVYYKGDVAKAQNLSAVEMCERDLQTLKENGLSEEFQCDDMSVIGDAKLVISSKK